MVVKTREIPQTAKPPVKVVAASSMDTPTFAGHFTKRHKGSLADLAELPANMPHEIEQMYRAFHRRLHEIRRYRHEHEEEEVEVSVDRAIEALFENHNWGWKQLAGLDGCLVAVFPSGEIATSVRGKIKHHKEIDEATDRLCSVLDN
jgi:4-alpha-glucanotransferase